MARARNRVVVGLLAALALAAPACASIPEPGSTGATPIGELDVVVTSSTSTSTPARPPGSGPATSTTSSLPPVASSTGTAPPSRTCSPDEPGRAAEDAVAAAGATGSAGPMVIPGSAPLLHDDALALGPEDEEVVYRATMDVRRLGTGDAVAVSDIELDPEHGGGDPTVVVGRLPAGSRTFSPVVTLARCSISLTASDTTTAWLAVRAALGTANELVAIDLATGAERWRWISASTVQWLSAASPGVVRVIDGEGDRPLALTTFAAGTGEVLSTTELPRFENDTVLESDGDIWLATRADPQRGVPPASTTYRQLDPESGAVLGTIEAPDEVGGDGRPFEPSWAGAVGPWLWRISGDRLEQRSTTDGAVRSFQLGSGAYPSALASIGPSGLWIVAFSGIDGAGGTVIHATREGGGADGASVVGPFAVGITRNHRGPYVIDLSRLTADHRGFTYRDNFDGGYEFGPATTWAFDT